MASDNQPVSDKRRRLFKALSAAPVVATLKPGEALARMSSYQCLTQDMGHAQPYFFLQEDVADAKLRCNDADSGCYAYEERYYWLFSGNGSNTCVNDWLVVDVTRIGSSPEELWLVNGLATAPLKVSDAASSGVVVVDATNGSTDKKLSYTGGTCQDNNLNATRKTGLFLAVGNPVDENLSPTLVDPIGWKSDGVYPKFIPDNTGTQNLAGTCLDSFGHTSDFTLAKG